MLDYPPTEDPNDRLDDELPLLHRVLDAIFKCMKRKAFSSPQDYIGVVLYNTEETFSDKRDSDSRENVYSLQSIEQLNGDNIRKFKKLVDDFKSDPDLLARKFKPCKFDNDRTSMPIGNLYITCNRFIRNVAPKNVSKRIFHITCNDDPQQKSPSEWFKTAETNAKDLLEAGIRIEPFFIAPISTDKDIKLSFNFKKFYSKILPNDEHLDEEQVDASMNEGLAKFDTLEEKLKKLEVPKRTSFTHRFELGEGFTISIKGYRTVVDQKFFPYYQVAENEKGELEKVDRITKLYDELTGEDVDRSDIRTGFAIGDKSDEGSLIIPIDKKVYESIRSFNLMVGLKLIGFKDRNTLSVIHNTGQATFIYPTEQVIEGSTRTFSALLKSCLKLNKLGIVRAVMRKNASPIFCALLPQEEIVDVDDGSQITPPGFYLIPLPFSDYLRDPPQHQSVQANEYQVNAATKWLKKLRKKAGFDPDQYKNPAWELMRMNIESLALDEPLEMSQFKDETLPRVKEMEKYAADPIENWKSSIGWMEASEELTISNKRKREDDDTLYFDNNNDMLTFWRSGQLQKLKVNELKQFCNVKNLTISGKKAEIIQRISEYFEKNYA